MTVRSPAKINWTLRVIGRRADGYHEIESLVSAITLCDELTFTGRVDSGFALQCDHPQVPAGLENLVVRAAALLSEQVGRRQGVSCRLQKRIPVGGGLGGGSSNAAATLRALNRWWSLDWPVDRLMPLAAVLGSDVPFFLQGGSGVIRGRGERVRRMPLAWRGWIVLLLPELSVSTAAAYQAWRPGGTPEPPTEGASTAGDAITLMQRTFNMLEPAAERVCPPLRGLRERGAALAGRPVRLSGSGASLFTAFDQQIEAENFARRAAEALRVRTCTVQPVEDAHQ